MWHSRMMESGLSVYLNEFLAKLFEIPKIIHIFARFFTEARIFVRGRDTINNV